MTAVARRGAALAGVWLLPWTVLVGPAGVDLVFLWGLVNPATGHVVGLPAYLFVHTRGLPDRLLAWPASTLLFIVGSAAVLVEGRWRGDRRLTPGLVGLAGLGHLAFSIGLARRGTATVLPLGPAYTAVLAWWLYSTMETASVGRER